MKNFLLIATIFSLLTISLPASTLVGSTQLDAEAKLICLCGCNQTIKSCPHVKCGFAIPARTKLVNLFSEGKSISEVMDIFLEEYGQEILAAPKKEGFNLLGYIIPFVALFAAAGLIWFIVRSWTAKGLKDEQKTISMAKKDFGSDIDKQIEKELEELD